jgi:hypothetical protein
MSRVGFKPTIPAFEWAKRVHALDRAATAAIFVTTYKTEEQASSSYTVHMRSRQTWKIGAIYDNLNGRAWMTQVYKLSTLQILYV